MTWFFNNFNISSMKIKTSKVLFLGFFLFYGANIFSQAPLDLDWDLTKFTRDTPPGRWVLLNGQVEGYRVLDASTQGYTVEVTLVYASWEEAETIRSWRGIITFTGSTFEPIFPARVGLTRGSQVVLPGQKLIILARHTGWSNTQQAALFSGAQIRPITF